MPRSGDRARQGANSRVKISKTSFSHPSRGHRPSLPGRTCAVCGCRSSPPMGTDDWFGRERGLGEAENSNLVYAGDFDANEIELLELSDDLLRRALDGEELVFKGAHDEEAVLCTNDTTYLVKRVETSNTLLLIRGAAGVINDTVDGVDGNPSQNQNENDTTTPAKRRRSSVSEFPSTPSTTPKPAHLRTTFLPNEENQPDLVAHAQAESHLELIETEPRMEKVWAALANAPHAFAGTDNDKKLDETWFGNFTDGDVGEEGVPDPPKKGLTEDEVVDLARASRSECLDVRNVFHQIPASLFSHTRLTLFFGPITVAAFRRRF